MTNVPTNSDGDLGMCKCGKVTLYMRGLDSRAIGWCRSENHGMMPGKVPTMCGEVERC
jgi:hypothetical protein